MADEKRDKSGKWKKGVSGNPKGGPKKVREFTVACRNLTADVLRVWREILLDDSAKHLDRLRAAEMLMAYAWGKPKQDVQVSGDGTESKDVVISLIVDGQPQTIATNLQ